MDDRSGAPSTGTTELVRHARDGDRQAIEALAARLRPRLLRWAAGRVPAARRRHIDTEDVVQEALTAALGRLDKLEAPEAFPAYTRRTVLNKLADLGRRPAAETTLGDDPVAVEEGPSASARMLRAEQMNAYEHALAELEPREQLAVIGNLEWGLTHRELATELGLASPDAARMAAARAIAKLARSIGYLL